MCDDKLIRAVIRTCYVLRTVRLGGRLNIIGYGWGRDLVAAQPMTSSRIPGPIDVNFVTLQFAI